MILFFKKLRQQFLKENQFTKYLLYAIGEIFLVVIGILIALQINNWNGDRKAREQTVKLLKNLLDEMKQDSISFNYIFNVEQNRYLPAAQLLFDEHSKEEDIHQYDTTLAHAFRFGSFFPSITFSDNAFKALINTNLMDHIQSEELKNNLLNYYGKIHYLIGYSNQNQGYIMDLWMALNEYHTIAPLEGSGIRNNDNLTGSGEDPFIIYYDLEAFKRDKSLNVHLYDLIDIHKDRVGVLNDIRKLSTNILLEINEELSRQK